VTEVPELYYGYAVTIDIVAALRYQGVIVGGASVVAPSKHEGCSCVGIRRMKC